MVVTNSFLNYFRLQAKDEQADEAASPTPVVKEAAKKLTNQFNFSERASQTYNNPYRVSKLEMIA